MSTGAYAACARLDMTVVPLMLDSGPLLETLAGLGPLTLACAPEAPPGKHPVCIELWRVLEGCPEAGGANQHLWLEWTGAATGAMTAGPVGAALGASYGGLVGARAGGLLGTWLGPVGWWWGTTTGWWAGAMMGGAAATAYGAAVAGRTSRGMSEAASRVLGTYHEASILVPDVILRGGSGEPHVFVLGMLTDSAMARRLAELFETGFRKRLAVIASSAFERYEARTPEGDLLAMASLAPEEPSRWLPARDEPGLVAARRWLAQPLLGHVGEGRFAATRLDRFYDDASVRASGVSGCLKIGPGFAPGVPPGDYELRPAAAAHPVGAFQVSRVPVRLAYPHALELRGSSCRPR